MFDKIIQKLGQIAEEENMSYLLDFMVYHFLDTCMKDTYFNIAEINL